MGRDCQTISLTFSYEEFICISRFLLSIQWLKSQKRQNFKISHNSTLLLAVKLHGEPHEQYHIINYINQLKAFDLCCILTNK